MPQGTVAAMRRAVPIALLAATAVLASAASAAACATDGAASLGQRLARADGAFVGRLVKRRGRLFVYRVEVRVQGRIGRRVRVQGLRGCEPSGIVKVVFLYTVTERPGTVLKE